MIDLTTIDKTTITPDSSTIGATPYAPGYTPGHQTLRRELDRLLDAMIGGGGSGVPYQGYQGWNGMPLQGGMATPFQAWPVSATPADVIETQTEYRLWLDLPGVDPDSVKLSISGAHLHIKAQRGTPEAGDEALAVYSERRSGAVQRSLRLPFEVEAQDIQATLRNGVLELTIAKPGAHSNVVEIPLRAA